ncbi:MAG: hypothetical protein O9274_05635 [Limnobacter sp.]|uniref:hypothetical protein n=1 Tax=Limnobacter sp. TaxID=2003368 RepID=UPI0022C72B16|nr:hypothetical protein [Limnobacter sp.]MCZ8015160.1 hypothetical protein [Limnobacter sp.]
MNGNSSKNVLGSNRSLQLEQEKIQIENMVNRHLDYKDREAFAEFKHVGRIGAWWNKKIVVYTVKGKDGDKVRRPVINGVLTVEQCSLDLKKVFMFTVVSRMKQTKYKN